jgi:uncharacterized protein
MTDEPTTHSTTHAQATKPTFDPTAIIAASLAIQERSVRAVVELLSEGATVPFIARYRKEATGGLDEVQIRDIETQRTYVIELEQRRQSILDEIEKQGKLTDDLRAKILRCTQKSELEDLYLPFKPKRRTRAMIAKELGLEPLALRILQQDLCGDPLTDAQAFVSTTEERNVPTAKIALSGARDIVAEVLAETAAVRAFARKLYMDTAVLSVEKAAEVTGPTKFESWYDYREPIKQMASHRFLAVKRGETENVLRSTLEVDTDTAKGEIARIAKRNASSPWAAELDLAISDAWKRLIAPSVESEVRVELKMQADKGAVDVFASNLRALLLAGPLGARTVIGIDPGQRTGCKVAVVDQSGKLQEHTVLYLVQGDESVERAKKTLIALVAKYQPVAIAIGNGTHGRETDAFVRDVLREQKTIFSVLVSESGASIYSASDIAREEFPELDLTVRGAISIARRLQDPLAELVKVDPKSIGVGQYQHDVYQALLAKKLDEVVESCVNMVGVELNTASAPLLSRVAGIGPTIAKRIVAFRESNGAFSSRKAVMTVTGLGPKTYEQCAGFLRVRDSDNPLDNSGVHPERYALVEQMAKDLSVDVRALVGNDTMVERIKWTRYVTADVGEPTLKDILAELRKPGRDPREVFEPPSFRDDVRAIEDLKPGMTLDGVVTNVTAFGAFVDIGVHQDGLVHVSQLSDRFVKDPAEVVKPGDKLKVRVLEIDLVRKRISLSAKSGEGPKQGAYGKDASVGGQARMAHSGNPRSTTDHRRPAAPSQAKTNQVKGSFTNNPFERLLKK